MKIYIIRHGQTETNRENKLLGVIDEGINLNGYKQVLKASSEIKNISFDVCFSSPYKRTMETAMILCEKRFPIIVDDRLKERGFGLLEGGPRNFKYNSDYWDYYLNKSDYEVESIQNLFKRTKNFIDFLKEEYSDKCVLIVSHAATIRALHYNIIGFNESTNMLSFQVDNAEILQYEI